VASLPLLLLTDARFPAGGYAHSGGLEAAVENGLGVDEVPLFLAGRLSGVTTAESSLAVAAARAERSDDLEGLLALDLEALARCPSPPLRAASNRLGAQLLRSASVVWPSDEVIERYRGASDATPRPVAFGVVGAAAGLDDHELAQAYLYEDAAMVTTAAARLLPLDATTAARWLVEAGPTIERLANDAAATDTDIRQLPGGFAPALEMASLAHATREGKLFAT
jgi:urease accessory protein